MSALPLVVVAVGGFFGGWLARDLLATWPRRRVGEIDTSRRRR